MPVQLRPKPAEFHVFDTTLRDGSQQEGLNPSVPDKLAIAALLDELGVTFIEGGWPGANPGDTAFFSAMAEGQLRLTNAQLVAFGFTRRVGMKAADDPLTAAVITPIGELRNDTGSYVIGGGETGETTAALRKNLLDIQYGRAADTHGWLRRIL